MSDADTAVRSATAPTSTRRWFVPSFGIPAVLSGRARPIVAAALAGLVVALCVFGYFATRPAEWSARVTLVAAADGGQNNDSAALGTIANLTLPGVEAVATSGSVLSAVSRSVPGSPDAEELARTLNVQIVPTSAVVRIAIVTDDQTVSRRIVRAVAQRVVAADLLAPVGTFSVVDSDPSARKVSPDLLAGAGFALVAGMGVAAGVLVVMILAQPGLTSARAIRRVLDDPSIGVVDLDEPGGRAVVGALLGPIQPQLLPVGRTEDAALDRASEVLDPAAGEDGSRSLVLVAQRGRVKRSELRTAIALARRSGRVVNALLVV